MKKQQPTSVDCKLLDRLIPDPSLGRLLGILAMSYEMQPEFFETDFLPTLLGLGAWDDRSWTSRIALEKHLAELEAATMLVDARPYRKRPRSLRVQVVPVQLGLGRLLHAKVLIGVYDESVRLIIGSANLTEPGYRRNREIVGVLTASAKRAAYVHLIADAIGEMGRLLDPWTTDSARRLQSLALQRLEEWAVGENLAAEQQWFAWGGAEQPLWQQFLSRWPTTDQVERISIVSPFWSEENADGPVKSFVTALRQNGTLAMNAEVRLLTDATPDTQASYRPKLPESYGHFDARALGIQASALAIDPRVPPEEVGIGEGVSVTRSLHAKIVLLEGSHNSLIFIGSANFTKHGWGFLPDGIKPNVEAGLIFRRSGAGSSELRNFIPRTTGDPVPLDGAAAARLALLDPMPDQFPWPAFLREVLLAVSANDVEQLELVISIADAVAGPWSISHLPMDDCPKQVLLAVEQIEPARICYRVSLGKDGIVRLLREQEVHVEWWQCPEGRAFPINVSENVRMTLPISPETGRPEERALIAYYQGWITWEDLFPDPEAIPGSNNSHEPEGGVDTSRIQSYIIRDFVEALEGIRNDLKAAAHSPPACMRLALLGSVSPVALANRILEAADTGARTPMASGFQLVEILACLETARHAEAAARYQEDWFVLVDQAAIRVAAMLDAIQQRHPEDFSRDFRRYAKTVRQHHLGKVAKG